MGFPDGLVVKNLPANAGDAGSESLGLGDPLEKEMATHSSILAWEIPWTEEPGNPWGCEESDIIEQLNNSINKINTQFSSVTRSCPTLCNPINRSTPGLPVHHQLPESTQTHVHQVSDAIQPSHPLSSLSPPDPNPSQHQGLFQ